MPKVYVFDTYAKSGAGRILHFDVLMTENAPDKALEYARDWLRGLSDPLVQVAPENCAFCHITDTVPPNMQQAIAEKGYAIYKLEGCPK